MHSTQHDTFKFVPSLLDFISLTCLGGKLPSHKQSCLYAIYPFCFYITDYYTKDDVVIAHYVILELQTISQYCVPSDCNNLNLPYASSIFTTKFVVEYFIFDYIRKIFP